MARRVHRVEAEALLRSSIQAEVDAVAGNVWVSRKEAPRLSPLLRRVETSLRAEGGKGARVRASTLVERAVHEVLSLWEAVDPAGPGVDAALLSKKELAEIDDRDSVVGALLIALAEQIRSGGASSPDPAANLAAVKAALGALELMEHTVLEQLPELQALDLRAGQADRRKAPAAVQQSFDVFYRMEAADIGGVRAYRGKVAGVSVWLLHASTDGDEAWLEAWTQEGQALLSGRWFGGVLLAWDEFFGRGRLDPGPVRARRYKKEEGLSEPEERIAAGQLPKDWVAGRALRSGQLTRSGRQLLTITLADTLSEPERELAWAALGLIWDRGLRYRDLNHSTLELGLPRGEGELHIGHFTRPNDHIPYEVAWWRDIDDGSFVFYFVRVDGALALAIEQFDN